MIYGYARVSTVKQKNDGNSLEDQEAKLREHGAAEIYVDAFTGTKLDRPNFQKLLSVVQPGDTIIATKLDRISRSASQGSALVDDLLSRGVSVHILNMGVMDQTPTGRLIRNILFSFAEFERDMIVERTQEGKAVARQRADYHEGRKRKEVEGFEKIAQKQKEGLITVAEACRMLGIGRSTYYLRLKEVS